MTGLLKKLESKPKSPLVVLKNIGSLTVRIFEADSEAILDKPSGIDIF